MLVPSPSGGSDISGISSVIEHIQQVKKKHSPVAFMKVSNVSEMYSYQADAMHPLPAGNVDMFNGIGLCKCAPTSSYQTSTVSDTHTRAHTYIKRTRDHCLAHTI